ncbi:9446_t:CDS:2, partial [Paraglomus occultum]
GKYIRAISTIRFLATKATLTLYRTASNSARAETTIEVTTRPPVLVEGHSQESVSGQPQFAETLQSA